MGVFVCTRSIFRSSLSSTRAKTETREFILARSAGEWSNYLGTEGYRNSIIFLSFPSNKYKALCIRIHSKQTQFRAMSGWVAICFWRISRCALLHCSFWNFEYTSQSNLSFVPFFFFLFLPLFFCFLLYYVLIWRMFFRLVHVCGLTFHLINLILVRSLVWGISMNVIKGVLRNTWMD